MSVTRNIKHYIISIFTLLFVLSNNVFALEMQNSISFQNDFDLTIQKGEACLRKFNKFNVVVQNRIIMSETISSYAAIYKTNIICPYANQNGDTICSKPLKSLVPMSDEADPIKREKKNVIMICQLRPLGLISQDPSTPWQISMTYERVLNNHFSAVLDLEVGRFLTKSYYYYEAKYGGGDAPNPRLTDYEVVQYDGFAINPEIRYYPFNWKKEAPRGAFLAVNYTHIRVQRKYLLPQSTTTLSGYGNIYGAGLTTGYKAGRENIFFEFFLGYGICSDYGFNANEPVNSDLQPGKNDYKFLMLRYAANFGFRF